ncbi:MAG TPA: hypothetical protein PKB03_05685 [Baekduia sp.]|nr:hypothetical protein [Baekduia sp.]
MTETRIGAVIPARSTSERLPGKQLADLGGRPVIVRMIERLAMSPHLSLDQVVLCTTEDATDDELAAVAAAAGASVFRGDRDDLIRRLGDAVDEHRLDIVVEADGDDPFIDVAYVDLAIERLLAQPQVDVVLPPELPLGMAAKVVRGSAFQRVRESYRSTRNDTGFMYFFTRTGLFAVEAVAPIAGSDVRPDIRLTLDYEEDLALLRAVFAELGGSIAPFATSDVVELMERRPELLELNAHVADEYWARTEDLVDLRFERDGQIYVLRASGSSASLSDVEPHEGTAG